MSQRLSHNQQSPESFKKLMELSLSLNSSSIEHPLRDLIAIRVAQLNGCAFCTDMHIKQARIGGERELRIHHLIVWRESTLFTGRERAALAWAEILTHLPAHGVPDDAYAAVRAHLSEKEVSDLTYVIAVNNMWNRFGVGFQLVPGSADALYGLDKSGLN